MGFIIRLDEPSKEIKEVFKQYSENGFMTIDDLLRFLTDYQKDSNVTQKDAQKIFGSLKYLNIFQRRSLSLDAFFQYLLSDLNIPLPSKVHHDMDAPLSHYFLYTTHHNSDITGNQPSRASTIDTIVKALKKGIRVIEMELWTKSNNVGVDVRHAGTLSLGADLENCLHGIKDNAFIASEYPVLIIFEDLQTLNPDLQDQVARMITKIFGDLLYYPDYSDQFPSPNTLKRKVLILIEPPTDYLESDNDKQDGLDNGESIEEEDEEKAAPEFKKLIGIHTMKTKGHSDLRPKLMQSKLKRLSISQQQLEKAIQTDQEHINTILRFTQWNIMNVHPTDLCFGSSNYNPYSGWIHGAQMVTLNMQGTRKYLSIMQGMSRANGGCGNVKKPQILLENPTFPQPLKVKIKIYQGEGWHLDFPFAANDLPVLFIKNRINGVLCDESKKQTTLKIRWVPEWNEEFEFELRYPELAVLHIKALCEETPEAPPHFGGQTSLPMPELKSGIRVVPLSNQNGEQYKHTRLLMQFQIETSSNF